MAGRDFTVDNSKVVAALRDRIGDLVVEVASYKVALNDLAERAEELAAENATLKAQIEAPPNQEG